MTEWFDALNTLQQALFLIAVFSTTIFVIQLLVTLSGIGGDEFDVEASDGSSFDFGDVFSIRNGVSFLMGFSWGGLMAYDWGLSHEAMVVTVGFLVGSFFVMVNIALFLALSRLRHSGNLQIENAIGADGTVSLTIPENRSGVGKVMINIQGRLKELHAITDGEALAKNTSIIVDDITGSHMLVSKLNE